MDKTQVRPKNTIKFPIKGDPKYIDVLDEDPIIKDQQWLVISFISPEGIRNTTLRGFKLRCVEKNEELAKKKADEYRKLDNGKFDVFVGQVGKWLPWDPDRNTVKTQVYLESELNDLVQGHMDQMEKAKKMHQERTEEHKRLLKDDKKTTERKERMKKKALEISEQKQRINEMKQDIKDGRIPMMVPSLVNEEKQLEEMEKTLNQKREVLSNKSDELYTEYKSIEKLDTVKNDANKLFKDISGRNVPESEESIKIKQYYDELTS
jgi:uncharacterized phage infection (PIP) family protein YhgE